ncbi:MAG: flagellar biosynthesis anti-sigma factor FlgM [Fibrobacterota bacterium]
MRIHAVSQPYSAELRKIENAKKVDKDQKAGKADKSEFSDGAKRLSETKAQFQAIEASLSVQPEVRMDKITEVREKIENGYYNTPEFLEKLTNKMMNEFGFKDPNSK